MDMQNFEKIKLPVAANIGAGLAGLVIPGFLLMFLCDKELFINLDFWKLLVLSVSACLPTFVLPFGLSGLFHRILNHDHPKIVSLWGTPVDWYLRHAFNNSINMYTAVLAAWLFDLSTSGVVWVLFSCSVFSALLELFHLCWFIKHPSALYSVWFLLDSTQSKPEEAL